MTLPTRELHGERDLARRPATGASVTTVKSAFPNCDYLVSGGHTFAEEGAQAFTVAVTSTGIGTGSGSGNGQAQISDAPLHSAPVASFSVPEATTFGATIATFADDDPGGAVGDYGATVAWGDGGSGAAVITVEAGGRFGVFANHRYAQPGAYTAAVGIADVGGSPTSVDVPITVTDPGLTATGAAMPALVEGQAVNGAVATFTDGDGSRAPGNYGATIAWGDGTTGAGTVVARPGGGFEVDGAHAYANPATYPVTTAIADLSGTAQATTSTTVGVADAVLASTTLQFGATEGAPFTATVAGFGDGDPTPRPPGYYTASVDWGDGSPAGGASVVATGAGAFAVTASHAYARAGSFPVTVTIGDPGGQQTTAVSSAVVADAGLTASATPISAVAGTAFDTTVAGFADADPNGSAGLYTATVDWGDGSATSNPAIAANPAGGFVVDAGHTYAAAGTFTTTITVTDRGGSTASSTAQATVSAPPPPPPPPPAVTESTPQPTTSSTTPTPAAVKPAPPAPPPVVGVSPPRVLSSTAFSLRLSCPASAARCRGVARVITLPGRGQRSTLRSGTALGSSLFLLGSGESRTVTIPVPLRLRRTLRKARSARLAGVAIAFGASGHNVAATGPTAVLSTTGLR